jgi:hypothetical protein
MKKIRPKSVRDCQKARTNEWRERYYALGLTYKKVDGQWGWAPKKGQAPAKIHGLSPDQIEEIRRKIRQVKEEERKAGKKAGGS